MGLKSFSVCALAASFVAISCWHGAGAQGPAAEPGAIQSVLPPDPGAPRTVAMFDLFCITHVPNLETIAEFASANFEEITGAAVEPYRPTVEPRELRAWRFSDFGEEFVLTTTRSSPDEVFAANVPEFADATSHACTLFLPSAIPQGEIRAELTRLMARAPDDTFTPGTLNAAGWTGRTPPKVVPRMMVDVMHLAPVNGDGGGRLQTVAFVLAPPSGAKGNAQ
jgi:hypothetical protein